MTDQRTPDDRLPPDEGVERALSIAVDSLMDGLGIGGPTRRAWSHEWLRRYTEGVIEAALLDRLRLAPLDVERLARALPYWRENNRETCIADAQVTLANLGLPEEPIERHPDEARNAALRKYERSIGIDREPVSREPREPR